MKNYILKMFISDKTTNFVVSIRFSTFMPQKKVYNIDHMFCFSRFGESNGSIKHQIGRSTLSKRK